MCRASDYISSVSSCGWCVWRENFFEYVYTDDIVLIAGGGGGECTGGTGSDWCPLHPLCPRGPGSISCGGQ